VRLALFGGTFDPPHVGHLLAASDAHEQLGLEQVVFIPAARQPLKRDSSAAPAPHRLRMLQLMTEGDARFAVDPVEIDRTGLSYTVDTLEEFARRLPDSERYFLVGEDTFGTLGQWREPERVVALAHMAVLSRSSGRSMTPIGQDEVARRVLAIGGGGAASPVVLGTRRVDLSSTEVRERVRSGRSIRGFVTERVAQYIDANSLYR
jgi:nicotinate-nucleotide adenylyltransferase